MALQFRKVKRKVMNGPEEGQEKYYALARTSGVSTLDKMCKLICARSSMSSADVKAVFDSLNWAMGLELDSGNVVQLGELGNFRLSLSSEGAATEEELDATMIRQARIIFTPGSALRKMRSEVTFTPVKLIEKECTKEHEDEPEGGI